MSKLARFPARQQIVNGDGTATPEFIRWLSQTLGLSIESSASQSDVDDAVLDAFMNAVSLAQQGDAELKVVLEAELQELALTPARADGAPPDDLSPPREPLPPADDPITRIQALEAQVAALERRVHDLQLGYQL